MKKNIFIVAEDYNLSKKMASNIASFFSMRIFDTVEMFEFDHSPRKLNEVLSDFGLDYVEKEFKSIIKMSLDFDDVVVATDFQFIDSWNALFNKIQEKNLVIYLSNKNICDKDEDRQKLRLKFLTDCCDVAIKINDLPENEIYDKIISEIKQYYKLEV